jgi:hypothetical protein
MKIFTCYEVSYPGAKLYTRVKKLVRNQTPHAHNSCRQIYIKFLFFHLKPFCVEMYVCTHSCNPLCNKTNFLTAKNPKINFRRSVETKKKHNAFQNTGFQLLKCIAWPARYCKHYELNTLIEKNSKWWQD